MDEGLLAVEPLGKAWVLKQFDDNPRLHRMLSPPVVDRLTNQALAVPYASDLEYLHDLEVDMVLKKTLLGLEDLQIGQELSFFKKNQLDSEACQQYTAALNAVKANFGRGVAKKLRHHAPVDTKPQERQGRPLLPRLVRLAIKFGLSEKEKLALNFIVVQAIGQEFTRSGNVKLTMSDRIIANRFGGGRRSNYSFESLLRYSDMTINEAIAFLKSTRPYLTQGLFVVDKTSPMQNDYIDIPHETIAVMTGSELTAAELLKIDKTKLAEVVEEEKDAAAVAAPSTEQPMREETKAKLQELSDQLQQEGKAEEPPKAEESPRQAPVDLPAEPTEAKPESSPAVEKSNAMDTGAVQEPAGPPSGDVYDFVRLQRQIEAGGGATSSAAALPLIDSTATTASKSGQLLEFLDHTKEIGTEDDEDDNLTVITPYKTDIEYLSDQIKWIATKLKIKRMTAKTQDAFGFDYGNDQQLDTKVRELRAKERMLKAKCQKRLEMTRQTDWLPRLERLALACKLDEFEKVVLLTLVGGVISQDISSLNYDFMTGQRNSGFTVGGLLQLFCKGFQEEIKARPYFYTAGTLVKEGIIQLSERWGDLMGVKIELDRRMLDFIVGLDTEFSELVEGSHSYYPKVKMDQVVLPDDSKKLILETVEGFECYKKFRKDLGFEETITYGNGILLLFYGTSGTGKTMMANALGNKLGKRILLINFTSLGGNQADEVIKFIFREAKLTDSILFFDECEQIFLSRDKGGNEVNLLLTEIERHDGLIIMATNRAFDLDEAMHRRVTLAIEFRQPDPVLRQKIWRAHVPSGLTLADDIDWKALAMKYELTGGFIKNAVLSALSSAVNRDKENPVIKHEDLERGSRLQLRGRLGMVDFDRRVVPTRGIEDIIADDAVVKQLQEIINFEKARQVLFGQWGYSEKMCYDQGTTALFYGLPGVGKTLAAEAVGFETGKPLKVINCAELVSKYVGETAKNIEYVFKEARTLDAILVFDEAESLFGARSDKQDSSTDRYANLDVGLLLYHLERFPGIVILTTNLMPTLDSAFHRRLRFMVEFPTPDVKLREKLWRIHLPPNAPLAPDVDLAKLAGRFAFAGGNIKNVCFKAASRAALRLDNARITMDDLEDCAQKELEKGGGGKENPALLYS